MSTPASNFLQPAKHKVTKRNHLFIYLVSKFFLQLFLSFKLCKLIISPCDPSKAIVTLLMKADFRSEGILIKSTNFLEQKL